MSRADELFIQNCKGMNYKMEMMWLKIGSVDLELPLII